MLKRCCLAMFFLYLLQFESNLLFTVGDRKKPINFTLNNEQYQLSSESNTSSASWALANLIDSVIDQSCDALLILCSGSMQSIFSTNSHIVTLCSFDWHWPQSTPNQEQQPPPPTQSSCPTPQLVLTTATAGTKLYKTENSRGPALDFVHPALMASSPYVWIRRGPCGRN